MAAEIHAPTSRVTGSQFIFDVIPDIVQYDRLRVGIRMQAVILHQRPVQYDSVKEKWHEAYIIEIGKSVVHVLEPGGVHRTIIRRDPHFEQQGINPVFMQHRNHSPQIAFRLRDRDPAQAIVGTELNDNELRPVPFEQATEARDPALRRLAADTRVLYPVRITVLGKTLLQERGPTAIEPNAVTRAETVTDNENYLISSQRWWAHQRDET